MEANKEKTVHPITSEDTLGRVLRMHRKNLNLTQKEAGQKFNMSQKTISQIENGRPSVQLQTLFKLMAALKVEIHLRPRDKVINDKDLW